VRRPIAAAALLAAFTLSVAGPPGVAAAQQPSDVAACLDGSCTLTVSGPVEVPLDGHAGPTALSVREVGIFGVAFAVHSGGGHSYAMTGTGGTVRFASAQGALTVRVLELRNGSAVIELSSTPSGT
jgi:hypothetical protein